MATDSEFRTPRAATASMGILLAAFAAGAVYVALWTSEDDLLNARVRRGGGLVKMLEQTIGWDAFVLLLFLVAFVLGIYAVAFLWRAADGRPDVAIRADRIEFHPALRPAPAMFDDIRSWEVDQVNGAPSLCMMFEQRYWSLMGLVPRKSLKIDGKPAPLAAFIDQLVHHPVLGAKRTG